MHFALSCVYGYALWDTQQPHTIADNFLVAVFASNHVYTLLSRYEYFYIAITIVNFISIYQYIGISHTSLLCSVYESFVLLTRLIVRVKCLFCAVWGNSWCKTNWNTLIKRSLNCYIVHPCKINFHNSIAYQLECNGPYLHWCHRAKMAALVWGLS